jgi:hypothetical protein
MPPAIHSGQAAIPCGFGGHRGNIVEKIGDSERILPHTMKIVPVEMYELRIPDLTLGTISKAG